jgi:TonB family protein
LTILSKARPSYTDLARVYEIEGKVILRVTFLATGEIGSLTPVTTLPFGLTNQAMAAARRITFEPKVVNGTPVNVTRQVEYSFSIF